MTYSSSHVPPSSLMKWIPGIRWVPHDIGIPSQGGERSEKPKSHRISLPFPRRDKQKRNAQSKPEELTSGAGVRDRRSPTWTARVSTLSFTGDDENDRQIQARTHNQRQSSFFGKLPYELRVMVYEYLVEKGETVHLTLGAKKRKYGHFLCEERELEEIVALLERADMSHRDCGCKVLVGGSNDCRKLEDGIFAMMQTCRRGYLETMPYLYTPHTFSFLHITHLLHLPSRLPAVRLDSIRTVRLRWTIRTLPFLKRSISSKRYAYPEDTANWVNGWEILANMQGLRDLFVTLTEVTPWRATWERQWLEMEEKVMAPVMQVVRPTRFVVVLPYESCRVDGWEVGECNVVFRRPSHVQAAVNI
ncbi:uncharacterized protein EI97DRAFT_433042 [Westerdykella ornata]|uniref:DUF7730 domain-containing protein n=1 Tax=Westerdykella ornata TaxID=318751 RepID=A0A6A6JJP5_WESOR|nr:uncharacterized protein EI97DRAFT_433042 [Westerdykella ornata]KAF2276811.1 hypothetical protein EI97DRAFT_433042 [Westerdykella ornata]